jgi:hypothetical protein
MGDTITAGIGATVINRSLLNNALNSVETNRGKDAADLLRTLSLAVEQSGDVAAKSLFESFSEQIQKPAAQKPVLTSLWEGLLKKDQSRPGSNRRLPERSNG